MRTTTRTRALRVLLAGLLLGLAQQAQAQLDCIVATREEGFDARQRGAQSVRRAALAVASIVQKNAVFMQGNKPVRVRTSISYYGDGHAEASVITTAYNQKAWLSDGCTISKFADRGGGLADGGIAIYINNPDSMLSGRLGDQALRAHAAPLRQGSMAGHPVFAISGNAANARVLLSKAGYEPWVAVTLAEVLDWRERELDLREAEMRRARQSAADGLNEAKIEEMYQSMRKFDQAGAEKMRDDMLSKLPKMRADAARQAADGEALLSGHRAELTSYRASLTPAQLAAPGNHQAGTWARAGLVRAEDSQGGLMSRVDPAYASRDPNRIHLLMVAISPHPKASPQYAWAQASYAALDYAALAALLD